MPPSPLRSLMALAAIAFVATARADPDVIGPADDEGPLTPYGDALAEWHAGNRIRARHEFERLADAGDVRAQLLLSTFNVSGEGLEKNLPQAYAWAYLAASEDPYAFGHGAQPTALQWKRTLEEQLTGPDLLKGERIARKVLDAHVGEYCGNLERATTYFKERQETPGLVSRIGCVLDPTQPACRSIRAELPSISHCSGQFPDASAETDVRRIIEPSRLVYPDLAQRYSWEGRVIFAAHLDPSGYACRIVLVKGSGYRVMDEAVLEAAAAWHFSSYQHDGVGVEVVRPFSVQFALTKDGKSGQHK